MDDVSIQKHILSRSRILYICNAIFHLEVQERNPFHLHLHESRISYIFIDFIARDIIPGQWKLQLLDFFFHFGEITYPSV